jgi:DNA-directed RNA polymerase subunit RPC12/RpoP
MIRYLCGRCQSLLESPDQSAGAAVLCPTCQATLAVPGQPTGGPASPVQSGQADPSQIRVVCPACQSVLKAPARKAGRRAKCPTCRQRLLVPAHHGNDPLIGQCMASGPDGSSPTLPTASPVFSTQPTTDLSQPLPAVRPRGSLTTALFCFSLFMFLIGLSTIMCVPPLTGLCWILAIVCFFAAASLRYAGFR